MPLTTQPTLTSRSFYAAFVSEFLEADDDQIIGKLSRHHVALHEAAEGEQIRAWERELKILRTAFQVVGEKCATWSILLEVSLHRLGKRLDAVVLSPGVVSVVEFKVGASRYDSAAWLQTESYAHALRDFHQASQTRVIVPILCAEKGPDRPIRVRTFEGIADLIETNARTLAVGLDAAAQLGHGSNEVQNWREFDESPYRPTPTIIDAARAIYAGHQIAEIGRGDASDEALQRTASALKAAVRDAESRREKTVCFVTGAPGAGKTLLGLDLALTRTHGAAPAVLLSGNRPLVHVLTEALATDSAARTQMSKEKARQQADAAIQNLLGYLKQYTTGEVPPEHVIVFDEAQRAWDAQVGEKLLGRPQSEPEIFLDILNRLPWACLVCLVGPGQEINRGEGGLALWGAALAKAVARGQPWRVLAAPQALRGGPAVAGPGLLPTEGIASFPVHEEPRFHLTNSLRAFRNERQVQWVAKLLEGNLQGARNVAAEMAVPPALLSRDLSETKAWLRQYRRGGRSTGLLASSGAVRLVADGVPPAPRSNELDAIGHWFLKPFTDYRSAGALETPLSEFGCQGLEVDYVGLCWGGDLLWGETGWMARRMRAPRWQKVADAEHQRFRVNSYRVLLTRARAGTVIYVPQGADEDPTRNPSDLDSVADALMRAGCQPLTGIPTPLRVEE
ncbi:DUF2075 domain-containing protein [Corallococcus exercitus]|uniref:DNA/RNA helicase domain-containing protein n=1 Tax=Corallococcus exercitus TaxID=2316736 RepID=UPI000EA3DB58|nr:DNA/RNA helicase domain-containing protein [Corallococcus exercitus]RKG76691.1 DUF2075 domain-containing protein [Corallococcus exercitus]